VRVFIFFLTHKLQPQPLGYLLHDVHIQVRHPPALPVKVQLRFVWVEVEGESIRIRICSFCNVQVIYFICNESMLIELCLTLTISHQSNIFF